MSGVGKTTAARAFARKHDLRLYSLDARTYEHEAKLPRETRTLDELWIDQTPEELADWFEEYARRRFALVLEDLSRIEDDAPTVVDGPQLLPELVTPLGPALFVVAAPNLQRELVTARGSSTYARTGDPERALANRLERDAILADRLRAAAEVVEINDVSETAGVIERFFGPQISEWIARPDHGDVGARRRDENDARLRQVRAHAAATGSDPSRELDLACECSRAGCAEVVRISLAAAERAPRPLVAAGH